MITGKKPSNGRSPSSVIAAIVNYDPPAVSKLQPGSPPLFDHLLMACLAKDRDKRWQSIADVSIQLHLIRDSTGETRLSPEHGWFKRHWEWASAAAALVLLLSIALTVVIIRGTSP